MFTDFVPHLCESSHFADFFDESDARVNEERNAGHYSRKLILGDLARISHSIEYVDCICERVGDFLYWSGSRFLEVVAANIDWVP